VVQAMRSSGRSSQHHWASHVHHGQHTLFNSASVFARARSGAHTVARVHHACNCMQPCSTSSCRQTKRTHRPACHADVVFVPSATGSPDAAWYVPINPWCCRYDGAVPDALAALTAHSASADVTDITQAVMQTVLLRASVWRLRVWCTMHMHLRGRFLQIVECADTLPLHLRRKPSREIREVGTITLVS
jgi:hypothetical protein